MFKSLLQTIPTISGNFTLACKLNNYTENNYNEYTSYINDAILMPLDNNYVLTKDIKINLINSKYEYDIIKYFKEISAYFYNDTYLKNSNIFETYTQDDILPDNRDKNFEFGCKRISYNKYHYQYQFYAPIYINNVDDLPDEFVIEFYTENSLLKTIHIPINKKSAKNKLRIYLNKFISKIENNTPIVWNFNDNKIIYKNAIDCKNGGLVTITSYNTLDSKNIYQTIINDIDNLICDNYSQNNIILSECIPLSFLFNLNDLLTINDIYYYNFNQFYIVGYYMKNNMKCDFYTFSTNYHYNYLTYNTFNNIDNSLNKIKYNIFDNDIIYSLKEGTNYKLYYQNTFKNRYCQWKLLESDTYIINLNTVFTYNTLNNKFPIFKNSLKYTLYGLFNDNTLYVPINNHVNTYNKYDQSQYNLLINNNYTNWFKIYNKDIEKNYKDELQLVQNNYTFINGVRYYINDNSIKYFNIFINPIIEEYNSDIIVGNVILEKHKDNNELVYYTYLEENNQFYAECDRPTVNDPEDKPIYIEYNMETKYINYIDNIDSTLYDFYKFNIENIILNDYNSIFKELISFIYNKNIDQDLYKDKYLNIFNIYFNYISGYEKLDIYIDNYTENELLNIFNRNKDLKNQIYYSLPNTKDKNNLYYDLYKHVVDYQYLINNNVSFFIKRNFIEINNIDQFYINIFGSNGLYTNIYNKYYNINENNNNQITVNSFIEYLKLIITDKTNWFSDSSLNIEFKNYVNIINKIETQNFKYTISNNLLNDVLDLMIYVIIYNNIIDYINKNSNINVYKYIPYYNDNNIIVNYDYYEKLHNKTDYFNLYTNIKLSNDVLNKDVYVLIDNLDLLNYYIVNDQNNYLNIYHKQDEFTNIFKSYKFINLVDYINTYIVDNILTKDNDITSLYINDKYVSTEELIDILNTDKTNAQYLLQLLKENITFIGNSAVIQLICITNDSKKIYELPINLYIRTTLYLLTSGVESYDSPTDPLIIYKEMPDDNNILVNSIYTDFSFNKKHNFKYQQLMKNIYKIDNQYTYKNPYYYLIKTTVKDYLENYNHDIKTYSKLDNINVLNIDYVYPDKTLTNNEQTAYIILNYHIMLSTNLLNIYNVDNNDNFEIQYINGIKIDDINFKELFKTIYPYIKQDILLNFILQVNNDNNIPVNIILPNNIKCNINTVVSKKKDNLNFTTISLTNDILQRLYLNRYFGNIDPYFIKIKQIINNVRSKIYMINDNGVINTPVKCDNNNVYIENINIYNYNQIPYYQNNKINQLNYVNQLEYKHFNNNYLFNLLNEIYIEVDDIEYVYQEQLSEYITKEKCYIYFKKYLKNNFINYKINNNENLFLYIFNKYSIEYIQSSEFNNVLKKVYKITYKLTLL